MQEKLTARQKLAVMTLSAGGSITRAAVSANVSRETLYRWMNKPAFTQALDSATDESIKAMARRLAGLADSALDELENLLTDEVTPAGQKLRAIEITLGRLFEARELVDFERRLDALERKAGR